MKIRLTHVITSVLIMFFSSVTQAQIAKRFDVVINELLPDPTPMVGLPNSEYVELKNAASFPINLRNWKLTDGSTTATISQNYILQPDSLVIVCATSAVPSFAAFGNAIGVTGFPSLNNDADLIWLISPEQNIIHAVSYSVEWFNNSVKIEGGWSLEMIDPRNPCSGSSNWKASLNPKGGSPGQKNSVEAINPDRTLPKLIRTYSLDIASIVAVFDEPVDSVSASIATKYSIDHGIGSASQAIPIEPIFNEVRLKFYGSFSSDSVYQLRVSDVTDCAGNSIGAFNTVKTGSVSTCDSLDLVINEILFNPTSDGADYVETFNRSNKILDASKLYIASRNSSGVIVSSKKISETPFLIFPGDFVTVTEERSLILRKFIVKNPDML
ncbi:MAG TPA: lamin tail domain-containing protein, partial [Chitinophagaceae bacterium]|nr:lamin tail domain-containing protein [Chitinophagaceae bacterium]